MTLNPAFPKLSDLVQAARKDENGEAAYFSEAEKRKRLEIELELVRTSMAEMTTRLNEGSAGRLPYEQNRQFEKIADPYLAANRMSQAYCRIVMLEQRILEDSATRAAREAKELAERLRRVEAAERRAARAPLLEKEQRIRRAAGLAGRDAFPGMHRLEREDLLKEILEEFEEFADYRGDPLDLVAQLCQDIARTKGADLSDIPHFEDCIGEPDDDLEDFAHRCRSWAGTCLDWIDEQDLPAEPPELAHGPPAAA